MKEPKFKVGDIVRPIEGKLISNGIEITTILSAKIKEYNTNDRSSSSVIEICITDVITNTNNKISGSWYVYEDAFELIILKDDDYEVF